jgi:hypothetical protein
MRQRAENGDKSRDEQAARPDEERATRLVKPGTHHQREGSRIGTSRYYGTRGIGSDCPFF